MLEGVFASILAFLVVRIVRIRASRSQVLPALISGGVALAGAWACVLFGEQALTGRAYFRTENTLISVLAGTAAIISVVVLTRVTRRR